MRKRTRSLIAVVVLVVVAVAGGIWWFLRDDAPDQASLDDVVEAASATTPATVDGQVTVTVDDAETTVVSSAGTATSGTAASIDGAWAIDPEFGEFDYESATGSFAGFRVQEELRGIGSTTAVGRTGDVTGSITIDGTTLTAAEFEVDLTTITTNDRRRDDRVQSALGTSQHPTATFVLSAPVELGDAAATGGPVAVTIAGDLTVNGITQAISIDIDAQLVAATNRIALAGSTELTFSDFDVAVPSAPLVLSADDHGILELQFILEPST